MTPAGTGVAPVAFISTELVTDVFLGTATVFILLVVAMFYRAVKGPSTQDRVLAVNVLGTNTVVVLALLAAALGEPSLLDIALVYALLNFLMAVAISKFTVERGGVL